MNYNKQVYVIESLYPDDTSDIPAIEAALDGSGFEIRPYASIESVEAFGAAINDIKVKSRKPRTLMGPFIHISAHGKRGSLCGGIEIAPSAVLMKWRILDSFLSDFYSVVSSCAVLYLSACYGLSFRKYTALTTNLITNRLAYYGVVSAENPIPIEEDDNESIRACQVFYKEISMGTVIRDDKNIPQSIIGKLAESCPRSGFKAELHPNWEAYDKKTRQQHKDDGVA